MMYYLFEYRTSEGKSPNTYGPFKCIEVIRAPKWLSNRLENNGIQHLYQRYEGACKHLYLNVEHENVIHGGHYEKIIKLVRDYKLDKLMDENI